ncbi:MAG: hypothetical protein Q7R97_04365 [Candidatus Daviesbacteria bacterium]|nr:hypothetical protein [Candidatus Daviesbacteria bacterium]
MKENLVTCLDFGSRTECKSCSEKERPLPLNWPENVALPCIVDVQKSVEEAELELGVRMKAIREEQRRLLTEAVRHGDFNVPVY